MRGSQHPWGRDGQAGRDPKTTKISVDFGLATVEKALATPFHGRFRGLFSWGAACSPSPERGIGESPVRRCGPFMYHSPLEGESARRSRAGGGKSAVRLHATEGVERPCCRTRAGNQSPSPPPCERVPLTRGDRELSVRPTLPASRIIAPWVGDAVPAPPPTTRLAVGSPFGYDSGS